ncbi:MAG: hypothetical protein E7081_00035 [Bacteroidales bacterium]|nr:hypothetical protein [Bacteroidales bacterium]
MLRYNCATICYIFVFMREASALLVPQCWAMRRPCKAGRVTVIGSHAFFVSTHLGSRCVI